ncbi:MAG: EcsC family protein [Candidatus Coatesbacteria bacterium]|nr:EcsC family protein [Candidatus Coatesbacteria bacterium]
MEKQSRTLKLLEWITHHSINGFPPLSSAEKLASRYIKNEKFADNDRRVKSLIKWEASKNFTTGFLTGLGGLITIPLSVPGSLAAAWLIQARMVGAIAIIYGHDIREDSVKTLLILCLQGDDIKKILKNAGVKITNRTLTQILIRTPSSVLIEINKKVGYRLVAKTGEKSIASMSKIIPVAGSVISGGIDAYACRKIGYIAKDIFSMQAIDKDKNEIQVKTDRI